MIHTYRFKNMNKMHDGLANALLFGTYDELDDWNSVDVQQHNVVASAKSMKFNYDVSTLWTTRARWNTLVRQYIDRDNLLAWLDVVENGFPTSRRGIAVLRTNTVAKRETGRGVIRRWGSCMLNLSVRMRPWPQITLHSRTCYLGYLSAFDLNVAHVCARLCANRLGLNVPDFSFIWQLEMAQYHGFRSIAFPLGDDMRDLGFRGWVDDGDRPGFKLANMWFERMRKLDEDGVLYGDMKFSSYRRVRRRWHTQSMGYDYAKKFEGGTYSPGSNAKAYRLIPPTYTKDLDFSPIGITE